MSVTLYCKNAPLGDAEKLTLSSDGNDCDSKKCKLNYCGAYGRGVAQSAFGGCVKCGGRFCVGAFSRNLASVTVKFLSCSIYLKVYLKIVHFECNLRR